MLNIFKNYKLKNMKKDVKIKPKKTGIFYIFLPGIPKENGIYETNQLGEGSFRSFYTKQGYHTLISLINTGDPLLNDITLCDSVGTQITPEEFIKILKGYDYIF